jgi:hypothetical protein
MTQAHSLHEFVEMPRVYTSAYVSIRQHTSAYVSIRQHTSAYETNEHTKRGTHADECLAGEGRSAKEVPQVQRA